MNSNLRCPCSELVHQPPVAIHALRSPRLADRRHAPARQPAAVPICGLARRVHQVSRPVCGPHRLGQPTRQPIGDTEIGRAQNPSRFVLRDG